MEGTRNKEGSSPERCRDLNGSNDVGTCCHQMWSVEEEQ